MINIKKLDKETYNLLNKEYCNFIVTKNINPLLKVLLREVFPNRNDILSGDSVEIPMVILYQIIKTLKNSLIVINHQTKMIVLLKKHLRNNIEKEL